MWPYHRRRAYQQGNVEMVLVPQSASWRCYVDYPRSFLSPFETTGSGTGKLFAADFASRSNGQPTHHYICSHAASCSSMGRNNPPVVGSHRCRSSCWRWTRVPHFPRLAALSGRFGPHVSQNSLSTHRGREFCQWLLSDGCPPHPQLLSPILVSSNIGTDTR